MDLFLCCFISGASFLLSFLLFFHPLEHNNSATKWLSLFIFIIGCAFIGTYMLKTEYINEHNFILKSLNGIQFLLAPSLYFSTLYFVTPTKKITKSDYIHFIPFLTYFFIACFEANEKQSIATYPVFTISHNVKFLVRDILPFQTLFYLIKSYIALKKHHQNIKLISSNISDINLNWMTHFLVIIFGTVLIWINDALLALPFLTDATQYIYTVAIFFLAYFSIKQKTIFDFKIKDIQEISAFLGYNNMPEANIKAHSNSGIAQNENIPCKAESTEKKQKIKRLTEERLGTLSIKLELLITQDKIYLNNNLSLPDIAQMLGISIHEASYLINETANDNFYNFINKYRVEEAKKLLSSTKIEELNILGIAFASGFNSKTTFNTTFKKVVGISPSQYAKMQKKE